MLLVEGQKTRFLLSSPTFCSTLEQKSDASSPLHETTPTNDFRKTYLSINGGRLSKAGLRTWNRPSDAWIGCQCTLGNEGWKAWLLCRWQHVFVFMEDDGVVAARDYFPWASKIPWVRLSNPIIILRLRLSELKHFTEMMRCFFRTTRGVVIQHFGCYGHGKSKVLTATFVPQGGGVGRNVGLGLGRCCNSFRVGLGPALWYFEDSRAGAKSFKILIDVYSEKSYSSYLSTSSRI